MSSAFEGLPKTPNLKLNKPGYDNVADIEALNENADILDAEIQGIKNTFVKSVNGKAPDAGGNVNVEKYTHPNSGVTAGTYRSVTVNAQGHVTAGSNPTLAIAQGGTGATTAKQARANLGIKDIATYDVLPIAQGGTGATTAKQARANLEVEPIGTIFAFAGNNIPKGYLPCNGSAISRTTYADLFTVIGTTYGAGDGSTTFNLPNLTDKFIQGSDTAGTVKSAGLPNIIGNVCGFVNQSTNQTNGALEIAKDYNTNVSIKGDQNWYVSLLLDASKSNAIYGSSTTVQPPALTMWYIIKY